MLKNNIIDTKYIDDDGRVKQLCIIDPDSIEDVSLKSKDVIAAGAIKKMIQSASANTPTVDLTDINNKINTLTRKTSQIDTVDDDGVVIENKQFSFKLGGTTIYNNSENFPLLSLPISNRTIVDSVANIDAEKIKCSNIDCSSTVKSGYLEVGQTSTFDGTITANGGILCMGTQISYNCGPQWNGLITSICLPSGTMLYANDAIYTSRITDGSNNKLAYLTDGTKAAIPDISGLQTSIDNLTTRVEALEARLLS